MIKEDSCRNFTIWIRDEIKDCALKAIDTDDAYKSCRFCAMVKAYAEVCKHLEISMYSGNETDAELFAIRSAAHW